MPRNVFLAVLICVFAAFLPRPVMAQFPGELAGTVRDAATGAPVEAASVEVAATGDVARTDGAGAFRLRGLEPGPARLRVRRAGYAEREVAVEVANGRTTRVDVALYAVAIALDALRVSAARDLPGDGTRFGRAEIEAGGARTAAEVAERAPGVVVRGTGPTSARTISIRGSSPDAVLVLVDGAPINDPVTGEADLSSVPAGSIESLTVLPGARTARYGPRAEAGVVVIETRAAGTRQALELSAGSLGEVGGRAEVGSRWGGIGWTLGGQGRRVGGGFDHARDPNDPTIQRRENADLEEWGAFGALSAGMGGGELRARGGWDALERGLPGTGHTPSPTARQEMSRGRGSLAWRRGGATTLSAVLTGATQRVHFADPAPPLGLAYDDTTRVRTATLRLDADRALRAGWLRGVGGGVEAAAQRVDAGGALNETAPRTRRDFGAFAHLLAGREIGAGRDLSFSAEGRLDRDGISGEWFVSRALTASAGIGDLRLQVANRSSFSPPSLGDQFFRDGVGVAPNPDLRAVRVPNEWEAGASWASAVGGAEVAASAAAYRGDVKGMIVWLPDFTFRWSPRNTDVKRRGVDTRGEVRLPAAAGVRLAGSWSLADVTYDRPGEAVQVAYRPRHSALLEAEVAPGAWRAGVAARYTGLRYTAVSAVNALPGFWSLEMDVAREWRVGRWAATTAARVDRLLDETESMIAGFPEPGRRLRLDLRLRRAEGR